LKKLFFTGLLFMLMTLVASTRDEAPRRIISLAPSLTKNLALLGSEELLVGCTNYCTLQGNTQAEVVANAVQVNYEKIVLLRPDLVIATNLTKTRTLETLRKLGIQLVVFRNPEDFETICTQFIELGELIGKRQKAEEIISGVQKRIEEVRTLIPSDHSSPARVFMQLGSKPLFTVVPGSFMNDYMVLSETKNMADDLEIGSINLETVLVRDPDVIIVVLMGMVGSEEKSRWESFPRLSAVRENRIYLLDADKACSPTPLSFVESLEAVIRMIYLGEPQLNH
jgi:iron complex transport system substrate-binding protein